MVFRHLSEHLQRSRDLDNSSDTPVDEPSNVSAYTVLHDAYRSVVPRAIYPPVRSNSLGHKAAKGLKIAVTSVDILNTFCNENLGYMQEISARLLTINVTSQDVEAFIKGVHILVEGLEKVAIVFPFTGAAVVAFRLVMESHIKRRENNEKVLIIKARMGDMMMALLQLRYIREPNAKDSEGVSVESRMSELMARIESDIKATGAACEHYSKKNALVRTMKARIYEERLATHANLFTKHREEFQFLLSLYTALGVQSANIKLDGVTDQLKLIETKLDDIHAIFRHLDSPRERDLRNFMNEHGGPEALLNDDDLLSEVMEKVENMDRSESGHGKRRPAKLEGFKAELLRELGEDLDATMRKHFDLFECKLEMQRQQLLDAQRQQDNLILTEIRAGFLHERIKHEDMRAIWQEMGWKGSVKARHFVLALRDHFVEKAETKALVDSAEPTSSDELDSVITLRDHAAPDWDPDNEDDRWTHSYISVTHVQPILEAIDDDATGFITVKEVNEFTSSRPTGWTLPIWIAFWAIGWQTSIDRYKAHIYGLLEQLLGLAKDVHIDNRVHVDEYLTDSVFNDLERMLRATKSCTNLVDLKLIQYVDAYTTEEEKKLEHRLKAIAYELDKPATVSLVTGPGRIERFLFPLVYLILKHHVQVMYYARTNILDSREFRDMKEALHTLFNVVYERVEGLVAIFRQSHASLKEELHYFAFGMFSLFHNPSRDPRNNTILTWQDRGAKPKYLDLSSAIPAKAVLHYNVAESIQSRASPKQFSNSSKTWHLGVKCDSCRKEIRGSRFICLACINEDFSENIDLCSQCRNQAVKRKCFTHEVFHPLLRVDAVVLDAELALSIPRAQVIATQIEDRLRPSDSTAVKNPVCGSCGKKSIDFCYKCIQCAMAIYYCSGCELDTCNGSAFVNERSHIHEAVQFAFYSPNHQLIRARRAQVSASMDQKLELLEQQVLMMQNQLDAIESILRQMSKQGKH